MQILRFAKQSYGIGSKFYTTIYRGVIQPMLSYGCAVWFNVVNYKYVHKIFNQIQRLIAIRCCGGYKTISGESAIILNNFMPLDLYIKQKASEFYLKRGIINSDINCYLNACRIDSELFQKPANFSSLPHPAKRVEIKECIESEDFTKVYTDGSKKSSAVGSSFCVFTSGVLIKKSKFKLYSHCSVFQAELYAIYQSLKYIKSLDITNATIYTDSQTSIKAVKNSSSTSRLVNHIHEELAQINDIDIQIKFVWISSHSGNTGNELADNLAKSAATSHQSYSYDLISASFAKSKIMEYNIIQWNQRWSTSQNGSHTKKFFPTIMDRQKCTQYFTSNFYTTQFITGHGKFNTYLQRFKLRNDNKCPCDDFSEQNPEHIIFHCQIYEQQRQNLKNKSVEKYGSFPCTAQQLINKDIYCIFKDFCKNVLS
jgi:ribonuclease HI